jgi:hypothetical protein
MMTDPNEPTLAEYLRSVQAYMAEEYPDTSLALLSGQVPEALNSMVNYIVWDGFLANLTAPYVCGTIAEQYRCSVSDQD